MMPKQPTSVEKGRCLSEVPEHPKGCMRLFSGPQCRVGDVLYLFSVTLGPICEFGQFRGRQYE